METPDLIACEVLDYWQQQAGVQIRSDKVKQATLRRITARLDEGFGPAELKRCVDYALYDEFYRTRGYYRQPDVIWRNGERVQSILARFSHEAARPLPL